MLKKPLGHASCKHCQPVWCEPARRRTGGTGKLRGVEGRTHRVYAVAGPRGALLRNITVILPWLRDITRSANCAAVLSEEVSRPMATSSSPRRLRNWARTWRKSWQSSLHLRCRVVHHRPRARCERRHVHGRLKRPLSIKCPGSQRYDGLFRVSPRRMPSCLASERPIHVPEGTDVDLTHSL